MEETMFYGELKVGDEITSLEKEATLEGYELPEIFGGLQLASQEDKAMEQAARLGVEPMHVSKMFGGVYLLQFVSEMITNWLPHPKAWVQGGKLSAKFVGPVKFDEKVTCRGRIKGKLAENGKAVLVCEVWVENGFGAKVVIGEARMCW
jgi:acyl dehydratase